MTDDDGVKSISALLKGTNLFSTVVYGLAAEGSDPESNPRPSCWVYPAKWGAEPFDGDDTDPVRVRVCHFEIAIHTRRDEGPGVPAIVAGVESAVHGKQFNTSTECVCETGTYRRFGGKLDPQHRLLLTGYFSYEI